MTVKGRAFEFEQVSDPIDGKVGGWNRADVLSIQRELALSHEYGREPIQRPGRGRVPFLDSGRKRNVRKEGDAGRDADADQGCAGLAAAAP
jgi:hypothetical protein